MGIDFSKFKKDPSAATSNLQSSLDNSKSRGSSNYGDENVWKPTVDKEGNGSALFRFIFDPSGEEFVEVRNHGFKKNGKWFIENCPRTHGWDEECAVCEHADVLKKGREWNDVPKEEQAAIRPFFSKLSYWSNIYVIKDPGSPENEGKVFKYRYGKKIADKIEAALHEDPLDGTPGFSAFDPFNGADFKMVIKDVAGWRNYDDSSFTASKPWLKAQKDMERIVTEESHDLSTLTAKDQFMDPAEIAKKLNKVLGIKTATTPKPQPSQDEEPAPRIEPESDSGKTETGNPMTGDMEDDYFASLVNDV